jgi:hypothetical protein
MVAQRFVVELDRRTVGIAVRVPGGFMFYASDDGFNDMDGRLFPRARAIERQLKKIARRHAPKGAGASGYWPDRLKFAAPSTSCHIKRDLEMGCAARGTSAPPYRD